MKIYYTASGEPSRYPTNKEAAKRRRSVKFYTGEPCPVHNEHSVQFTNSEKFTCCTNREAVKAFNSALKSGDPVDQKDAILRGFDHYWVPTCCAKDGHVGKRMAESGECWECAHTPRKLSPRQVAMSEGAKWYQATTPCRRGHLALRRVQDGACEQCLKEYKEATSSAPTLRETAPDLIIDKATAKGLGFNMFRTGKPCQRGHTGYRYISTGGCIDCKDSSD